MRKGAPDFPRLSLPGLHHGIDGLIGRMFSPAYGSGEGLHRRGTNTSCRHTEDQAEPASSDRVI